jgi:uncharacterized protein (DUF952 family)
MNCETIGTMHEIAPPFAPDDYIRVVDARVASIAKEKEKLRMPEILHITPRARWERAVADGEYRSDDLATEGFVHCLTSEQLPYVYGKFYKGRTGLVVLRIESEKLKSPLVWENPHETWKLFPHVYGPINPDAVVEVAPLEAVLARGNGG